MVLQVYNTDRAQFNKTVGQLVTVLLALARTQLTASELSLLVLDNLQAQEWVQKVRQIHHSTTKHASSANGVADASRLLLVVRQVRRVELGRRLASAEPHLWLPLTSSDDNFLYRPPYPSVN
jgi:hypothetical protein